ncbi:MAG: hypothetical protein GX603_05460 [Chloroflexi bacterium]|nr:hypothetical protein [Chloroflexota bacterium]
MKQRTPVIIAAVSGVLLLVAFFFQPFTSPYLGLVLNWAIILASVAFLVAIASLVVTHIRFIINGRKGFLFSLVFILAFVLTVVFGLYLGIDDQQYLEAIHTVLVPIQSALMGLIALVLMSAAVKLFRTRGWSILTVSFGGSALVFLFLNLGFLRLDFSEGLNDVIAMVQRLPVIGARGLLIGAGLGALLMALRVLFGQEAHNE